MPGLFAAGECTLGPFGANRIAAAITEMLVHGLAAGKNAGALARDTDPVEVEPEVFQAMQEKALMPLNRKTGSRPAQVRQQVQHMAHQHLGPIRDRAKLEDFISFLETIEQNDLPNLAASSDNRVQRCSR